MSGQLPAVSRDKMELRRPLGHFPLSSTASLLTRSQSQGVMEVEKVINPALQRGQDSSIKPVQKDSSIFNYCFQSREECQQEQACCLQNRRMQGSRSQELLPSTAVLLTHSPGCWWKCSIYLCGKSCEATRPLENRSVSEGLNESGESRAEQSEEKITHLDAESGSNRCWCLNQHQASIRKPEEAQTLLWLIKMIQKWEKPLLIFCILLFLFLYLILIWHSQLLSNDAICRLIFRQMSPCCFQGTERFVIRFDQSVNDFHRLVHWCC